MALVQDLAYIKEIVNDLKTDNKNTDTQINSIKDILSKLEARIRERELDSVTRKEHTEILNEVTVIRNSQTKTNLYFYITFVAINILLTLYLKFFS